MTPRFPVSPEKQAQLEERMRSLNIREDELEESFVRGSGSGGQKINRTSSCVLLRHRPTGLEVRCQSERSQGINRFIARRMLCDRFEEEILKLESANKRLANKIRKQKARRSRRSKIALVEAKRVRGTIKKLRSKPSRE